MEKDSEYYLDLYCKIRATELTSLQKALDDATDEFGGFDSIVVYYVLDHEKDINFTDQVDKLNHFNKHKLCSILTSSTYNIAKPWFKKFLLKAREDAEDKVWAEDLYDYYKKLFERVEDN